MKEQVAAFIIASRPKTLFIGLFPITLGSILAYKEGSFSYLLFFLSILGALSIQIGTNLSNDYFDHINQADTEKNSGKLKVLEKNLLSKKAIMQGFIIFFSIAFFISLALVYKLGWVFFLIISSCILFSYLYTAPPFPLAYHGLGDLFVLLFYGPVATLTTYYIHTGLAGSSYLFLASIPGLLGLGPLALNNLRDVTSDRKVEKKTLIVRFGERFGVFYIFGILLAVVVLPCLLFHSLIGLIPSIAFLGFLKKINMLFDYKNKERIHQLFISFAKAVAIYAALFCLVTFFYE